MAKRLSFRHLWLQISDEAPNCLLQVVSILMTLGAILWGLGVLGGDGRLAFSRSPGLMVFHPGTIASYFATLEPTG